MVKKSLHLHHFVMNQTNQTLDFKSEIVIFEKNNFKNKYPFKIKYIHSNSEYLHNLNLPRYTECFWSHHTLFIIEEHLQHSIKKIADAVFFLIPGNIKENDLEAVYLYIMNNNPQLQSLKVASTKKDARLFMARNYLFEKKINHINSDNSFEKMMLKSRRILTKIKALDIKDKDLIYLLNKGFH